MFGLCKMQNKYELILASGSPRRKELLAYLNIPFKIIVSDIDENIKEKDPQKLVRKLSILKGSAVFDKVKCDNPLIVSADTIVVLDNKVLGKPKDINEAKETLLLLSGKTHKVITGVSILTKNMSFNFTQTTYVDFYEIENRELNNYLESKDSLDKAGAYGIQGKAQIFIKGINGSYSNVVGFPVAEFIIELKKKLKTNKLQDAFILQL